MLFRSMENTYKPTVAVPVEALRLMVMHFGFAGTHTSFPLSNVTSRPMCALCAHAVGRVRLNVALQLQAVLRRRRSRSPVVRPRPIHTLAESGPLCYPLPLTPNPKVRSRLRSASRPSAPLDPANSVQIASLCGAGINVLERYAAPSYFHITYRFIPHAPSHSRSLIKAQRTS